MRIIKIILIVLVIALLDQSFGSSALHTVIVCWVLFGSLCYHDFRQHTQIKLTLLSGFFTWVFACLVGPLAILTIFSKPN